MLKLDSKLKKGLMCLVCAPHPVLPVILLGDHATVGSSAGFSDWLCLMEEYVSQDMIRSAS